jgi:NAD+ kinase
MQILRLCRELSIEAVIPEREAEKSAISRESGLATIVPALADEPVDFCLALGGDGTILRAFSHYRDMSTPVLGVNFGRVGFLSALSPADVPDRLKQVLEGSFNLMELSLLELEHHGARNLAVNDVVIHKPVAGSVVRLGYAVDGVQMDTISCDGMVVSTPAGSTAYNLSNGGPLLSLGLAAFILSAVAPHTLRFRPLVMGPEQRLTIVNESHSAAVEICVDGRSSSQLPAGEGLSVAISSRKARLVQVPGSDFHRRLRDKFIHPSA